MEGTINQCDFYINNWVTSEYAALRCLFHTFFNWVNKFLWNRTTHNLILKQDTASTLTWLHGKYNMSILPLTAGLFRVLVINFLNCPGDRLSKCNSGSTNICLHPEFAQQTIYDNIEMQLTHTSQNGLTRIFV